MTMTFHSLKRRSEVLRRRSDRQEGVALPDMTYNPLMQIHAVQHDIAYGDAAATHDRVRSILQDVEVQPGDMIVLPEMFATGFTRDMSTMTDEPGNASRDFITCLARQFNAYVMAGIVRNAADGRGRNMCIIIDPHGHEVFSYQKIHPFTFSGESDYFEAGAEIKIFQWQDATMCPVVCYDLRFPELFRHGVKRGAEIFTVIASWPTPREDHWVSLLKARAIENQAYVIGVNRCGSDPRNAFPGRTQIINPRGVILADAGREEGVISAEIDLPALREYRSKFPALADMRSGLMGENH